MTQDELVSEFTEYAKRDIEAPQINKGRAGNGAGCIDRITGKFSGSRRPSEASRASGVRCNGLLCVTASKLIL